MGYSFKTFLKHTAKDFYNQSVNPPVVRASTIIFKSLQDIRKMQKKYKKDPRGGHFDYGRQGTSTTHILQKILSELEESYHTFITPRKKSHSNACLICLLPGILTIGMLTIITKTKIDTKIAFNFKNCKFIKLNNLFLIEYNVITK